MNEDLTQEEVTLLERTVEEAHSSNTEDLKKELLDDIFDVEGAIPANSPTLLVDEQTSRFSAAIWFKEIQSKDIIFGGCGGIGSNTIFQISRMKPNNMSIYDDDIVEEGNMSGQLFSISQLGLKKVHAVNSTVMLYSDYTNIFCFSKKYEKNSDAADIMICGFDNMEARRIFFNNWLKRVNSKPKEERKKCLFIDGRLSFDTLQVLTITGDDEYNIKRYDKEFLFLDSEADRTICSLKQTTYLACMIASFITNNLVNFCANLVMDMKEFKAVPFFIEYSSDLMYLKTEL